jgi:cytoskeleton protein RodZ
MTSNHAAPTGALADANRGCGDRLRRAREAAGLTRAEVSARLKMPVRVVESLETEDWSRLGAPVFVRGQLRSYGRLLGMATDQVAAAPELMRVEPSVLVPRSFTPPMQRVAEQVARRLVYIVITAAIAVPVWLATRPHLAVPTGGAPLDLPIGAVIDGANTGDAAARPAAPKPLVASMASMPARAAAPALSLQFRDDSWIQVTRPDGSVLEKALVSRGEQRSYRAGQVAGIVLGNAGAVDVRSLGQAQDLAPFLRANVARLVVAPDGSLRSAAPEPRLTPPVR